MAAIFPNRRFLGKRLTCPVCKDSAFFSNFELAEYEGGRVFCDNHQPVVEMVDLADLLAIWGIPQRVELEVVELEDSHPDDFEDWSMDGLEEEQEHV
jgi:hypothetical protein